MSKLYEKLNKESEHIRLSHAEKNAMRAALFGAPSPLMLERKHSPYVFLAQPWMRALAAVLVVVFAGGGTAFASQGALPGQPLYAFKTNVVEPVKVALASTPAAKAAVHAQIAAERVAEAETLAQNGTLDATTSAALAANFESHAESAVMLADQASTSDPAAAVQVKAQLAADSSVGSAVLVALADNESDRPHVDAFAARVLAVNMGVRTDDHGGDRTNAMKVNAFAAKAPESQDSEPAPGARTMMAMTATGSSSETSDAEPMRTAAPKATITAAMSLGQGKAALELQGKATDALTNLKAQFAQASSTLDATTTVSIETSIDGIGALIADGNQALSDSILDTAISDFTQALGKAFRLSALLSAKARFNSPAIEPLFNRSDSRDSNSGDSQGGSSGDSGVGSTVHGLLDF